MKSCLLSPFFLFLAFAVSAQTPQKFNYQAVVRNQSGNIVASEPVGIRFSIRDVTSNGAIQFRESHTTSTNAFGLINLQVGNGVLVNGNFTNIGWGTGKKFLQVEVDVAGGTNYKDLATVELIAVPFALQAAHATNFTGAVAGDVTGTQTKTLIAPNAVTETKLADNSITTPKISTGSVTETKLADNAVTSGKIAANTISESKLADNSVTSTKIAAGAVGTTKIADNAVTTTKIATGAISETKLADNAVTALKIAPAQVVKSLNGLKDIVEIAASGAASLNITGNTITVDVSDVGDITGVSAGPGLTGGGNTGAVTLSAAFAGSGTANGVARSDHHHVAQSWTVPGNLGLLLRHTNATGVGLHVVSDGTDFNAAAISTEVSNPANSQSVGVYSSTFSNNQLSAAIYGQAATAGGAKAIMGIAGGSGTFGIYTQAIGFGSWAAYFDGRVHVNGTLSKAAGSFKIDHPLDPANKYLSHSFVESPDMMNIYNGNVVLNGNGEATVTLPDYFEALNKDFRYQLTAMGKPSPNIYIAQEIKGNRFQIAGGAPGGKISWTVTGIRHDTYANEHRIPVEEMKPSSARGKLLNGSMKKSQAANNGERIPINVSAAR